MNFGEALNNLIIEEVLTGLPIGIRRKKWGEDEYVILKIRKNNKVNSKILMKNNSNGLIAFIPDMIELVNATDWEIIKDINLTVDK